MQSDCPLFRNLKNALKCSICSKIVDNPIVSTKCEHIFCHICISGHINTCVNCPKCNVQFTKNALRKEPMISEIIQIFKNSEDKQPAFKNIPKPRIGNSTEFIYVKYFFKTPNEENIINSENCSNGLLYIPKYVTLDFLKIHIRRHHFLNNHAIKIYYKDYEMNSNSQISNIIESFGLGDELIITFEAKIYPFQELERDANEELKESNVLEREANKEPKGSNVLEREANKEPKESNFKTPEKPLIKKMIKRKKQKKLGDHWKLFRVFSQQKPPRIPNRVYCRCN
uniref:Postreplication repair E3 ubiquitin-protein ligase RAD18 like protein n=1 Tax=Dicyema japonicum TaxID=399803 RepID=D7URP8_DICJA|nr:postreplication repair E3 ubiquitin-protein ligase RAD18 like protein [Dicyema japonicum]